MEILWVIRKPLAFPLRHTLETQPKQPKQPSEGEDDMTFIRRIAIGTATAGFGLALAFGSATAAFADGPDTSKRTVQQINGKPWVKLEQGDREYRVAAVTCFLDYFDYVQGCDPTGELGDLYTEDLTNAVEEYQADNDLPVTGDVDAETWGALRDDVGLVKPGDSRKDVVRGVQYSLNIAGGAAVDVDGVYGKGTTTAVKNYQEHKEIDADGIVGPITFRALYASGAAS